MYFLLLFMSLASGQQINETFESYSNSTWQEGSVHGSWVHAYHGYGQVGVQYDGPSANKVLFQKPMPSNEPDETHASLVLSQDVFSQPSVRIRSKVVKQLRTPQPFPWETAWVLWNYKHDHHFYYFALKRNGWELGKVDNTKAVGSGPVCHWPAYKNCKYPGAQRFLATGRSPSAYIGRWHDIDVRQVSNKLTVYVDGALTVVHTDREAPYLSGKIGLYNEDAYVRFDLINAKSAAALLN